MSVSAFKEKSQVLADQYGWPLTIAKGYAMAKHSANSAGNRRSMPWSESTTIRRPSGPVTSMAAFRL